VLKLQLQIQTQGETSFSPAEAPFKGGMLHGLVETALTRYSPKLWTDLRGPDNRSPRYALRVPQDSATHWPGGHAFELGIMLFAPVQHLWGDVLAALTQGPPLHLGHTRSPCVAHDVRIHRPGAPSLSLLQAMSHAGQNLAHWQASPLPAQEAQQLRIQLQAPCLISSEGRRLDPQLALRPYTLSSIVRSVSRRMQTLEPTLAQAYGVGSSTWQASCQSLWPHQVASHSHISPRPWPYASRNTPGQHPVTIAAIEGEMHFSGPTPANIVSLLHIGQWMGLGQKTSLGMGWYGVETD